MADLEKSEYIVQLMLVRNQFNTLVKKIKADLPFEEQQEYEWTLPDIPMFEDLLQACIQKKV